MRAGKIIIMQKRYLLLLAVIVIVILAVYGSRNLDSTISIGDCSAKFSRDPVTVTSDLCGQNRTCVAQPADQQNNAVVDVLLCACDQAKAGNYQDSQLNSKIESLIKEYFGYNITSSSLCDQSAILTRRSYG
jgi:hypothetical protein